MSLAATIRVLRSMPLFAALDEPRLKVIAMTGQVLAFRPGERIAEKGDPGDAAFVVLDGAVEVLMPREDGEALLSTLGRGEIVGELAALTGHPRATALAAGAALTLLRLEREAVLALLREYPDVALGVIRVIAERLEAMNARAV